MPLSPDILRFSLQYNLRIHDIRPTWLCVVIEVLSIGMKCLEPSGYCTTIKNVFPFSTTNFLWLLRWRCDPVQTRVPNTSTLYVHLFCFEITLPRYEPQMMTGGCPRGVMVKAMDRGIVVSEFVFQSRYYVHFRANTLGKGMNPLILPAMG